jgi:hypothetical protein
MVAMAATLFFCVQLKIRLAPNRLKGQNAVDTALKTENALAISAFT